MSFHVLGQFRWCVCLWAGLIKTEGERTSQVLPWQLFLHCYAPLQVWLTSCQGGAVPKCATRDRNRFKHCPATRQHTADPCTKCVSRFFAWAPSGPWDSTEQVTSKRSDSEKISSTPAFHPSSAGVTKINDFCGLFLTSRQQSCHESSQ